MKDSYKLYKKTHKGMVMSFRLYNQIYKDYIEKIMEGISKGRTFNMKGRLSTIRLIRTPSNLWKSRLDYPKTMAEKKRKIEAGEPLVDEKGKKTYRVIDTKDNYFYIKWDKWKTRVSGQGAYKFSPLAKFLDIKREALTNKLNLINIKNK
ncbi:MAG: hypothetical protein U9Q40_03100 [Campylobacterota bacterium]|nr:hypothetical protein [Campylobacterota bacterium]